MPGTVSEVSATLVASTTRRPGCAGEDPLLLGRGQAGVEREDLGVAEVALGQRVGGVADLPLAGEEHEDVAVALALQLGHGVADGVELVAVRVGLGVVRVDEGR